MHMRNEWLQVQEDLQAILKQYMSRQDEVLSRWSTTAPAGLAFQAPSSPKSPTFEERSRTQATIPDEELFGNEYATGTELSVSGEHKKNSIGGASSSGHLTSLDSGDFESESRKPKLERKHSRNFGSAARADLKAEHSSTLRRAFYKRCTGLVKMWYELQEPPRTGLLANIVTSQAFEWMVVFVIILNGVFTVQQTNSDVQSPVQLQPEAWQSQVEVFFLVFYLVELGFKLAVHGRYFFCNSEMAWNIFDAALVILSIIDQVVLLFLPGTGQIKVVFIRVIRIVRLARILRGFKAMRVCTALRLMLRCLLGAVASLGWSIVMLLFIFYLFGLIFVQGIASHIHDEGPDGISDEHRGDIMDSFGSVQKAMVTLFKTAMGGQDWEVYYNLVEPFGNKVLFLFFVAFIQIALLNILTGIFVENALKLALPDLEVLAREYRTNELDDAEALRQLCADTDLGNGGQPISKEDFIRALTVDKVRAYMSVLGLPFRNPSSLYKQICSITGASPGELQREDFIVGCFRLRGHASNIDVHTVREQCQAIYHWQRKCHDKLEAQDLRLTLLPSTHSTVASTSQVQV